MRFLIIGLGSMGKRRIRCLKALGETEIAGFDIRLDRLQEAQNSYGITTYDNIDSVYADFNPEAVIVSNNPDSHMSYVLKAISKGCHVFSEISIVPDGIQEAIEAAKKTGLIIAASSTPRFKRAVIELRSLLETEKIGVCLAYTYHIGQYLPDWHPWEKMEDFFVSKRRTGGCKEILAIQLSSLSWLFGEIIEAKSERIILGNLGIDIDDYYHVSLYHQSNIHGSFVAEVLSQPSIVNLRIIGTEGTIVWNGSSEICFWTKKNGTWETLLCKGDSTNLKGYDGHVAEEPYVREIEDFLSAIARKTIPQFTLSDELKINLLLSRLSGEL